MTRVPSLAGSASGLSEADVLLAVHDALRVVLEHDGPLQRHTHLVDDLGADSLARIVIAEVLEERLEVRAPGFRIADQDLDGLVTVGHLVDHVMART